MYGSMRSDPRKFRLIATYVGPGGRGPNGTPMEDMQLPMSLSAVEFTCA